jgi:hypothetical protein
MKLVAEMGFLPPTTAKVEKAKMPPTSSARRDFLTFTAATKSRAIDVKLNGLNSSLQKKSQQSYTKNG